ncbi:MAG: ribosome assembly RNA-binding protein YhbY [Clostridia bacterium]|nr:ribosome assembly RNA-binding protein YhbY [Clostridia bacterium]
MFTSKQRSALKGLAMNIEPVAQIGKGGVNENFSESIDKALSARELIKISVLQNAEYSAEEYAEEIAEKVKAEVVCVIGRKIVLYRFSTKPNVKHVEF